MKINGMDFAYACQQRLHEEWLHAEFQRVIAKTLEKSEPVRYDDSGIAQVAEAVAQVIADHGPELPTDKDFLRFLTVKIRKPTKADIKRRFSSILVTIRWPWFKP